MENQILIDKVKNEIFVNDNQPRMDQETGKYSMFVFTLPNPNNSVTWDFPELENNWYIIGLSLLGPFIERQFIGEGPISVVRENEMRIRSVLNECVSREILSDYKIRYEFPTFD